MYLFSFFSCHTSTSCHRLSHWLFPYLHTPLFTRSDPPALTHTKCERERERERWEREREGRVFLVCTFKLHRPAAAASCQRIYSFLLFLIFTLFLIIWMERLLFSPQQSGKEIIIVVFSSFMMFKIGQISFGSSSNKRGNWLKATYLLKGLFYKLYILKLNGLSPVITMILITIHKHFFVISVELSSAAPLIDRVVTGPLLQDVYFLITSSKASEHILYINPHINGEERGGGGAVVFKAANWKKVKHERWACDGLKCGWWPVNLQHCDSLCFVLIPELKSVDLCTNALFLHLSLALRGGGGG